jgi:spermidine synthase
MRSLRPILILIGFTAVTAQVVLMRELLVLAGGAEVSLGLVLACWLLWTALGSGLVGRIKGGDPLRLVATLEALIALALPVTILAARAAKSALETVPGEIPAPGAVLLASLATIGPFCVLSGWLFAAGSRLYGAQAGASIARSSGTVYLLEAAGSAAGGLLASVLLIRHLGAIEIALLLAILNLVAAAWLVLGARLAALLAVVAGLALPFTAPRLESASLARLWRGFDLIAVRNSVYGNLVLAGREGSATLYENGLAVITVPDPQAAEEAVHYALLQHPSPESLLLIGGGINGSLAEALKHPSLRRVDYVELDPAILDLAEKYFSSSWSTVLKDPRVRVHPVDGRLFLKTTGAAFDVIIVSLPDPQTAQLNRFYTLEFFQEAARKLRPGGVLSFRLTGAENYVSPDLAAFLRCINKTLRAVFPEVRFLPGETVHFFASNAAGRLVDSAQGYLERLRSRGIQSSYVREYYLPFQMASDRMAALDAQIRPRPETPLNRDFSPIAYYFDAVLWSARFGRGAEPWLKRLKEVGYGEVLGATTVVALALVLLARRRTSRPLKKASLVPLASARGSEALAESTNTIGTATVRERSERLFQQPARAKAALAVTVMGWDMIGLEILLLLGFQAIYGYVYDQLAILIAAFMTGMAVGSWRSLRRKDELWPGDMRRLAAIQIVAAVAPLALCLLLEKLFTVRSALVFPVLTFLCGLIGGYQFPLANRVFFSGAPAARRGPGTLYALDLAGSCLGAVVFSLWLIPLFGFWATALVMGVVCAGSALALALPEPVR